MELVESAVGRKYNQENRVKSVLCHFLILCGTFVGLCCRNAFWWWYNV